MFVPTASKEWVIQPKPKPGRKPKKDIATSLKDDDEVRSSFGIFFSRLFTLDYRSIAKAGVCKTGQSVPHSTSDSLKLFYRAAQRAFRERKQSQLAELQARVQSYEQGEIERNVALQNIAKRLKEENEKLRKENALLKEKIDKAEQDRQLIPPEQNEKKRWRDDTPSTSSSAPPMRKKTRVASHSPSVNIPQFSASYLSSPASMVSSPDSNGTPDARYSPLPYDPQPAHTGSALNNLLVFPSSSPTKNTYQSNATDFTSFDCGFCSEDTPCVCREIALQQVAAEQRMQSITQDDNINSNDLKMEHFERNDRTTSMHIVESPTMPSVSILDNLPAYQPPVPLRRPNRTPGASLMTPVFRVAPPPQHTAGTPVNCSGDPNNCMACADDSFGRAFCTAMGESAASLPSCSDCPVNGGTSGSTACCGGDPSQCSHHSSTSISSRSQHSPDTIPTNDAWRQFKLHPNVEFTDLSLLADVVARRSKCTGPRVEISPAPSTPPPMLQSHHGGNAAAANLDQSIILTDPHAHYREKERERSSPPRLIPQEVLIRCGRQRIREVETVAVQDALRFLDAKFSHP